MVKIAPDGLDGLLAENRAEQEEGSVKKPHLKNGHEIRDSFFYYHFKDQKDFHKKLRTLEIYLAFENNRAAMGQEIVGINMLVNNFDRNISEKKPINLFYFYFQEDYLRRMDMHKRRTGQLPFESNEDMKTYVSYLIKLVKPNKYFMTNVMRGIYYSMIERNSPTRAGKSSNKEN